MGLVTIRDRHSGREVRNVGMIRVRLCAAS